jgi:hypothetical protein
MKKLIFTYLVSFLVFSVNTKIHAQEKLETSAKAQLNSWTTFNFENPLRYQLGARFIPQINLVKGSESIQFDAEFSFNTAGSLNYEKWENTGTYERFSPYRMWLRMSGANFEIRAGLQKINFGSASMLRPLMWFDRIDPRDPLQLTDGVYALLGKYYFKNNANIWLWGLAGNDETKGLEVIPSTPKDPELGGRFQFPVSTGELAVTFHHRTADRSEFFSNTTMQSKNTFPQNRYALDGKWDVGVGLWFEYVLQENKIKDVVFPYQYQHTANIGLDYTFGIGNGLNVSTELFYISQTDEIFTSESNAEISALAVNYPLGLIDRISAMVYYSWEDQSWYRFFNFQRTYDFWSFYLMGFWNPDQFVLYNINETRNLFSGKGIQFMAVYNF